MKHQETTAPAEPITRDPSAPPTIRARELRVLRAARAYTASGGIADAAELHEAVDALIWAQPDGAAREESERAP